MRTYIYQHFNDDLQLDNNCEGITLFGYGQNFLMGDLYNDGAIGTLLSKAEKIVDAGKKVSFGVIWGEYCGGSFYGSIPSLTLMESHHQGTGTIRSITVPVFFDNANGSNPFMAKLGSFLDWFSKSLYANKKVWNNIGNIKITGINQSSLEMRVPDQDFTPGNNQYAAAATKWINAGYTTNKCFNAISKMITLFMDYFPNKELALPFIAGLNGFPCVSDAGIVCGKNHRPDITARVLEVAKNYPQIKSQWNALNNLDPITKADIYQLNNSVWGKPVYSDIMEESLRNILSARTEIVEVFPRTVATFKNVFMVRGLEKTELNY